MVAQLKEKNSYFYCSNCRMRVPLKPYCAFCGYEFSNYETIAISHYELIAEEDINEKIISV